MISVFKTLCFSVLFFITFGYAQYSKNTTALIKCDYTRSYDKSIILPFLHSDSVHNINAALLTIANSHDTTFLHDVLQIRNKETLPYLFFCLAKLGESKISTSFLFQTIDSLDNAQLERLCVSAIGNTGDSSNLDHLVKRALLKDEKIVQGISLAIYNFNQRRIAHSGSASVFLNEINSDTRLHDALFAIYRTAADSVYIPRLENILNKKSYYDNSSEILQYTLGILRKLNYKPSNIAGLSSILNSSKSTSGAELARLLCSATIDSTSLQRIFKLLDSPNPQVQTQAAISFRNVSVNARNSKLVKDAIQKRFDKKSSDNLLYELCVTYHVLFPDDTAQIKHMSETLSRKQKLRLYGEIPDIFSEKTGELLAIFNICSKKEQFNIIQSLMKFSARKQNASIDSFVVHALQSNNIPVWSAFIENLDSAQYQINSSEIKSCIIHLVQAEKNNSQFSDIFASLFEVLPTLDKAFFSDYKSALTSTSIFSIQNLLNVKKTKDSAFLDTLLPYIWKSPKVRVITSKGSFTIKLKPEVAPISVGNFLYLQERNFFDGITFHRVVPGFVIQTGDPTATGSGGSEHEIITELAPEHFGEGAVGMARSSIDSESSQWFVCTGSYPHLDGNYTNFGDVSENFNVVHEIEQEDTVLHIELVK